MKKTLGQKLRELRENKGWTQLYAAKIFGITNGALSNYERDERIPDAKMLKKFAEIYEVSLDYLLDTTIPEEEEKTIDDEINEIMRELGPDVTIMFYDLKGMSEEEKEQLKIFLQGLLARRKMREQEEKGK
ncbi:MAG: helix-turn-helix domain-containing protein [Thermovenabulum sp.]|uniref:helix-turn-helix domain-containing protein n=1 Tax=Thermovenabulum sp. TaxID=3100335 RepID=UPI003C7BAB66